MPQRPVCWSTVDERHLASLVCVFAPCVHPTHEALFLNFSFERFSLLDDSAYICFVRQCLTIVFSLFRHVSKFSSSTLDANAFDSRFDCFWKFQYGSPGILPLVNQKVPIDHCQLHWGEFINRSEMKFGFFSLRLTFLQMPKVSTIR